MSISKTFLKTRAACKVKFHLSAEEVQDGASVHLVGDFNQWNHTSHPMKKLKDGSFSLEVELALGKDYQFRYLTESGQWVNDSAADAYVPCEFAGAENSLVKV